MPSSFFTPVTAQEPVATAIETFEKIKDSFALLSDGRVSTYGAYIAGAKSKKIVYMIGMDVLSVGLETKMQVTRLSGKSKNLPAEKLAADDVLSVAIFKIEASTKDYVTITKHPAAHEQANTSQWTLGSVQASGDLAQVNVEEILNDGKAFAVSGSEVSRAAGR